MTIDDVDFRQPLDQLELWLRGRSNDELRSLIKSQWSSEVEAIGSDTEGFMADWLDMKIGGVTALVAWSRNELVEFLLGLHEGPSEGDGYSRG